MAERTTVVDQTHDDALAAATKRAERPEADLVRLKSGASAPGTIRQAATGGQNSIDGEAELRKDSMMGHLLDSLAAGKDIGHYGRLVFAMVARYFLPHDQVLAWMMKGNDVDEQRRR